MLSQFTKEAPNHITLADLDYTFAKDVYPVGRLDADSEGLLILTSDKRLNVRLLNPNNKQPKTYWAQVEGAPNKEDLQPLNEGITIKIKKKVHQTAPAKAFLLEEEPQLPLRNPPIRYRKSIPTTWISLTLTEGKNRQVRRMCAAIGFPVLRLVRVGIAGYKYGEDQLKDMRVGEVLPLTELKS